jgi:hypothetical protein
LPDRAAVRKARAAKERPSAATAADDEEPLTTGRADITGPDPPLSHQPPASVDRFDSPERYEPRPGGWPRSRRQDPRQIPDARAVGDEPQQHPGLDRR